MSRFRQERTGKGGRRAANLRGSETEGGDRFVPAALDDRHLSPCVRRPLKIERRAYQPRGMRGNVVGMAVTVWTLSAQRKTGRRRVGFSLQPGLQEATYIE